MHERCDFALTISQSEFKATHLLNSTYSLNESAPLLNFPQAAEEMFQKSLNMSYIGLMSGKKEHPHPIRIDELEEHILTPPNFRQERVTISQVEVEEVEESESSIREEEAKYAFVRSLSKDGQELFASTGCTVCSSQIDKGKCLLGLVDQTIFEVYLPNQQGAFDMLILSFNFDTISAQVHYDEVPDNKEIEIITGKYRMIVEFQSEKLAAWWAHRLQRVVAQSKGQEFALMGLLQREDKPFFEEWFATENYFVNNCETGDIILFQDDHFFARAQRFFTRSDFDHVGMIVRDLNYGVLIFEANSGRGVSLTPWKYVIKFEWYKNIPKIAWRRLRRVQKNREFNEIVEKFVITNLERHYHISFAKITAQESILRPNPNLKPSEAPDQPEESGFFCSQLVATLYKELKLLTRDKMSPNYQPACKFYPKDFSQKSGRKLDRGQLSHEYTLFFDDRLIKQAYNGATDT